MKNKGFSIVELLFVIMILSALMLIAGISGKAWLDRSRVEGQMKEIYTDLMNARVSAMQKNRMYFVKLTSTQYTVYEDRDPDNPGNPALDGDGVLLPSDFQVLQKNLNPSYSLTIPPAAEEVDFDSRGIASAVPGPLGTQQTIRVTGSFGASYDCVTISATRIWMGVYDGSMCVVQ